MKSFSSLCYCGRSCQHLLFLWLGFLNTSELFFSEFTWTLFTCINTETEGGIESVRINGVYILRGLIVLSSILENVLDTFHWNKPSLYKNKILRKLNMTRDKRTHPWESSWNVTYIQNPSDGRTLCSWNHSKVALVYYLIKNTPLNNSEIGV